MRLVVRAAIAGSTLVFGCASIAGLDDKGAGEGQGNGPGTKNSDGTSLSSTSSSGSTSSGSNGTSGGAGPPGPSGDAAADANADTGVDATAAPCTKQKIGDTCSQNKDCCSNACANTGKCTSGCRSAFSGCVGTSEPCCFGLVCQTGFCHN